MGSIMAGQIAMGLDHEELIAINRPIVALRPFTEYTIPMVALLKTEKITQSAKMSFGDTLIEDLWLPYFAVSANLTTATTCIHEEGPGWFATRASDLPKPWRQANPDLPTMKVPHVGNSLEVLAMDDDAVVRSKPVQLLLRFNNAWLPFRDHDETWGGAEEARQGLEKRIGRYLPAASVDWADAGETTNDLWTRQALGSQNLRRVTPEDGAQPDEAFVSAFEFMSKYRVRDGLLPYGGDAFMSAEGRVVRIRLHGSDYRPGDTGWAHAGFVYRSSSMVWSTLSDHVFKCHYLFMNPVLMSTKRLLPLEQGLRHFLAAFHYRTAAINHGGVFTLVPPGGMFHRTTGFDWETLQHVQGWRRPSRTRPRLLGCRPFAFPAISQ